ncbi:hypothetical protein LJ753_13315 [Arthrobacter sp. zg-Y20]|uniref:DUF6541 family protein n=1 Tax=unclassified Arthrobacter TaxID=235627 RepID=UPI001D159BD8|nr:MULTISPECIES: DUF6541 family protein [unclassified Arthrobacter]MCC3276846.1 hypothetical protein [Arthrobacter sp. zg-Y20]MDK1317007.1 hypothetical protein [Arthrobacter sp. zg.Y20]WIB05279.1 hypothetical protein QNO06_12155 [Arthrobacter sp. zg-Y20]
MNWVYVLPYFFSGFAFLFVPGVAVGLALGLRGVPLIGLAAPLSISVISCTAVASGILGLPWGWPLVAAATAAAAVVVFLVRLLADRFAARSRPTGRRAAAVDVQAGFPWQGTAPALAGIAAGALIIAWRFIHMIHRPDYISQTFDGVFHLNATEYILETGTASSLTIGRMVNEGADISFYPAAWHDYISLLASTGSISVPEAISVGNILIAGLAWTTGCVFLVSRILGTRPMPLLLTGVLSAAFAAFPYLMIDFGVLYPNLLAIALMPACLGLAVSAAGASVRKDLGRWTALAALVLALPGMLLAHPSTLISFIALTLPLAALAAARLWQGLQGRGWLRVLPLAGTALYGVLTVVLWSRIRPDPTAATWYPVESAAQAAGEAFLSAPLGRPVPLMVAVLTFAGVVYCARNFQRLWWLLASFAVSCMLFVIVAGFPWGDLRTAFAGVWYNDPYRLAALLPVLGLPVAAVGAWSVVEALRGAFAGRFGTRHAAAVPGTSDGAEAIESVKTPRGRYVLPTVAVVLLVVLALTTQGKSIDTAQASGAANFALTGDSPLLSADESELLERVPEEVPEDAVVVGSPWTGASLVYALSGRRTLMPHIFYTLSPEGQTVVDRLDEMLTDPAVCQAVEDLNAYYVLDFGPKEVHGGDHPYAGLDDVGAASGFELVDQEGSAKLYRVSGCG